jgi:hypothetical protein
MSNRVLGVLLGAALLVGVLGCGPSGGERPARTADDEEKQGKTDARIGPLRTVWDHTPKFRECYDEARRTQSDLVLRSTLEITVDGKGRVSRVYLSSAKPLDESLKKCLVRVAEGIAFPPTGDSFVVKPAIVFQP